MPRDRLLFRLIAQTMEKTEAAISLPMWAKLRSACNRVSSNRGAIPEPARSDRCKIRQLGSAQMRRPRSRSRVLVGRDCAQFAQGLFARRRLHSSSFRAVRLAGHGAPPAPISAAGRFHFQGVQFISLISRAFSILQVHRVTHRCNFQVANFVVSHPAAAAACRQSKRHLPVNLFRLVRRAGFDEVPGMVARIPRLPAGASHLHARGIGESPDDLASFHRCRRDAPEKRGREPPVLALHWWRPKGRCTANPLIDFRRRRRRGQPLGLASRRIA